MFMSSGLRGFFLHKALMHQHSQIYHFDRSTEFDYMKDGPSKETSLKFLELVHFDSGGRIFTYILTLDSLFRFTETGKEFGIDMLSKHTMHSEVASYIAFSGEFFIRRLKHAHRDPPEVGGNNESHPPMDIGNGPPDDDPPQDPAYYELIIDNDSGTYRPKADLLPKLKEFMSHNFPGLKIVTLDCNTDAELQQKLKSEQRQKKKEEGDQIIYRQKAHGSSISSSDESKFNHIADSENGERPNRSFLNTMKNDIARQSKREKRHLKYLTKGRETYDKEKEVQKKQRMEALLHKEGESSGKHENRVKTPEKSATDPVLNGTDNKDKEIAVENGDGPVRTATVGGH
jgi:hypothetical protein